jgi:Ser/Thr protein kinase RdoA (MazF antagonist)
VTTDSDFLTRVAQETGLDARAGNLPAGFVSELLGAHYGLAGELTRIPSEKDDTFRLATGDAQYLVKIASAAEDAKVVNFQSSVMVHLERHAASIPAQSVIRGVRGQVESTIVDPDGDPRVLRVLSYLDGRLLDETVTTPEQFRRVGTALARLDDALRDFRHPKDSRLLIWDLKVFPELRPLIGYVTDREDRRLAESVFDRFQAQVVPVLDDLETQTIHGDFSPFNVLVDPSRPEFVSGVIDFGDVVRSPILFELSVPAANQIGVDPQRPWDTALEIVRGYRANRHLTQDEVALLAVTAPARLLSRALIFRWRATVHPDSRDYGLSHSTKDWGRLRATLAADETSVRAMLAGTDPRQ